MTIKRFVIFIIISLSLFSSTLAISVFLLHDNSEELLASYDKRYRSYLLADELRQSSDDLTRFARTYAITGDYQYKSYYNDVLAIRDGHQPRPINYERIYWDLIVNGKAPRGNGKAISLDDLMIELGFSQKEFEELKRAEDYSNELVLTETLAMSEIESFNYRNKQTSNTSNNIDKERFTILKTLFDQRYHAEKSKIMQPVDKFFVLLDNRTQLNVEKFTRRDQVIFNGLITVSFILILFTFLLSWLLIKYILRPLGSEPEELQVIADEITKGNFDREFKENSVGVYHSLSLMNESLRVNQVNNEHDLWLKNGSMQLNEALKSEKNMPDMSKKTLSMLATYLDASIGNLYIWQKNSHDGDDFLLANIARYACDSQSTKSEYTLGEGLVGQSALNKEVMILTDLPEGYCTIQSSTGSSQCKSLIIVPFYYRNQLKGVLELGFIHDIKSQYVDLLESIKESLGISMEGMLAKEELKKTLAISQTLSEELQTQQEELQVYNDELIEKTNDLEIQKNQLETSSRAIEKKSKELERANHYKSEFLTNMSHELRTPLNSLLILASSLKNNTSGHLDEEEVYSAKVIEDSGRHLLGLINHILDLSKLEAGYMEVCKSSMKLSTLKTALTDRFNVIADEKSLEFNFNIEANVPDEIMGDNLRIEQILTNLIGNALKFTKQGHVKVDVSTANDQLFFAVSDTGIGISEDKQEHVFQTFQQEDGSTTRKFGGTGLGLSISKELAKLLEGKITLTSKQDEGSCFTLIIDLLAVGPDDSPSNTSHQLTSSDVVIFDKSNNALLDFQIHDFSYCYWPKNSDVYSCDNLSETFKVAIIFWDYPSIKQNNASHAGVALLKYLAFQSMPVIVYRTSPLDNNDFMLVSQLSERIIIHSDEDNTHLNDEISRLRNHSANLSISAPAITNTITSNDSDSYEVAEQKDTVIEGDSKNENSQELDLAQFSDLSDKTILLVDDDMRNTFALAKALRAIDIKTEIALSCDQALQILAENSDIDLVCLDILMPNQDGYHALEKIRSNKHFENLPVITVTANSLESDKQKCLAAGADDYLAKPIEVNILLEKIQRLINKTNEPLK